MALVQDTAETGGRARTDRRYLGGRVVGVNQSTGSAQVDVGATLADGSPVYLEGVGFQKQNPPQPQDQVQFGYTNASSHSISLAGSTSSTSSGSSPQVTNVVDSLNGATGAVAAMQLNNGAGAPPNTPSGSVGGSVDNGLVVWIWSGGAWVDMATAYGIPAQLGISGLSCLGSYDGSFGVATANVQPAWLAPSGAVDGSNASFALPQKPLSVNSISLYWSATNPYGYALINPTAWTWDGNVTIAFGSAPAAGYLLCNIVYAN